MITESHVSACVSACRLGQAGGARKVVTSARCRRQLDGTSQHANSLQSDYELRDRAINVLVPAENASQSTLVAILELDSCLVASLVLHSQFTPCPPHSSQPRSWIPPSTWPLVPRLSLTLYALALARPNWRQLSQTARPKSLLAFCFLSASQHSHGTLGNTCPGPAWKHHSSTTLQRFATQGHHSATPTTCSLATD
jgi:hypothetical protein